MQLLIFITLAGHGRTFGDRIRLSDFFFLPLDACHTINIHKHHQTSACRLEDWQQGREFQCKQCPKCSRISRLMAWMDEGAGFWALLSFLMFLQDIGASFTKHRDRTDVPHPPAAPDRDVQSWIWFFSIIKHGHWCERQVPASRFLSTMLWTKYQLRCSP